jgi:hypothetical protein
MEDWMETWTRIHHHSYTVVAVVGLLATVGLAGPGDHVLALGPIRFDAYYATLAAFGFLLLLSLTDDYDRADYTLDRGDD